MSEPSIDFDPAMALASVHGARSDLAARLDEGSWRYDLTYSALAGLIVASQALPLGFNALGSALGAGALGLLARDWARRKGVWVCGVTPRRARWVSLGLGVTIAVLCGAVFLLTYRGESRWLALPAGLVAAGAALIGSRLWRNAFRRDLAEDFSGGGRLSTGVVLLGGIAVAALAGVAALLHADEMLTGWLLGVGVGMSVLSGVLMLRRRFRQSGAR